eukprot:9010305-Lingulodinium_polyedra.AAC.1
MGGRKWFADSPSLCLSVDASRIGGKDLLCGVLLGSKAGAFRSMWAVPQATGDSTSRGGFPPHEKGSETEFRE